MQREIKFRAWDTRKQMFTGWPIALTIKPRTVYQKQSDGTLQILPYILTKDAKNNQWVGEATSRYVLMQFTGLHDKNGKEIYEGDRVRFRWNPILGLPSDSQQWEYTLPVSYYAKWGCFVMLIPSIKGDNCPVAAGSPAEAGQPIEVIGNIYENPELLKEEK